MLKRIENFIITGENKRPIVADLYLTDKRKPAPLIIFCHGYKGFKDWGHFNLLPETFTESGFNFLKFNFSHNGGTPENPVDFPDLEAFSENNYSIELDDLQRVINWSTDKENEFSVNFDLNSLFLLGHSRGGGICILTAASDARVSRLVTWSAVGDFGRRFPSGENLAKWKEDGVYYVKNKRTRQNMPHKYQFYEDFIQNRSKLDIGEAEKKLTVPHLIIHGTKDETVYLGEALHLMTLNDAASLVKLKDATHTFGGSHPYQKKKLPKDAALAVEYTEVFFQIE